MPTRKRHKGNRQYLARGGLPTLSLGFVPGSPETNDFVQREQSTPERLTINNH